MDPMDCTSKLRFNWVWKTTAWDYLWILDCVKNHPRLEWNEIATKGS